jgi:carboxyl-terminal processing protease
MGVHPSFFLPDFPQRIEHSITAGIAGGSALSYDYNSDTQSNTSNASDTSAHAADGFVPAQGPDQTGNNGYQGGDSLPPPQRGRRRLDGLGQIFLTALLMALAFGAGWFGHSFYQGASSVPASERPYASILWQAWNIVDDHYVVRSAINPQKMTYGAISGMLATLGDTGHTRFLSPQEKQQEAQSLQGNYSGVGMYVQQDPATKQIYVVAPIPGSPAAKAGIKPNDAIIAVNGKKTVSMTLSQVSGLIQGPSGTKVTLMIQRPGVSHLLTFTITRESIQVPNVLMHYFANSHIADIQIVQFSDGVNDQLKQELQQAEKDGARGIVLDLRNNPGGYLDQAVAVASEFIKSGDHRNVLLQKDSSGNIQPFPVEAGGIATNIPIVVLVNHNTASAAEIVSGALQDNHRATIIGQRTFGTGTVLQEFDLSDGSAILLGTQEWLTPDGQFIRSQGITPNITVNMAASVTPDTPDIQSEEHQTTQDILHGQDVQLARAVQYLEQHYLQH